MEISIKSLILFGAVVLTGLSAGLFYAWSVSVIPGTQRITATTYLETMQAINRAILNPAFFLIFFGSAVLLGLSCIGQFNTSRMAFWLLLLSSIFYLAGTVGVTGLGNVPLNNELDNLNLTELTSNKLEEFRQYYETNWNRLHLIRTVFAVMAFILTVIAAMTHLQNQF